MAGDGITFQKASYNEVIEQAEEEEKFVLLDFTASWCKPCQLMKKETFTDADLGKYVNEHFVSTHVDVQKTEGRSLASKYGIRSIPTLIILDGKGRIVKTLIGYQTAEALLQELKPLATLK